MGQVIQGLVLGVTYRTGPLAWTDLHAGGLFFCVAYRECLRFGHHGRVRRWCEVLDDARPLDDEAKRLWADRAHGRYGANERGYLSCVFPNLELVGLPCAQVPELLAFHAWRPSSGVSFSVVYRRRSGKHQRRGI